MQKSGSVSINYVLLLRWQHELNSNPNMIIWVKIHNRKYDKQFNTIMMMMIIIIIIISQYYVGYSESKYRLRIFLAHPPDCHFAHVQ